MERLADDPVVHLRVDMDQEVAQPGKGTHPFGQSPLEDTVLLEHGEASRKSWGVRQPDDAMTWLAMSMQACADACTR